MTNITRLTSKGNKHIADSLFFILREQIEKDHLITPSILSASYSLDKQTNALITNYNYGHILVPIMMYDSDITEEKYIRLSMQNQEHMYKPGNHPWHRVNADLKIPNHVTLIDVEKLFEKSKINMIETINALRLPTGSDLVTVAKNLHACMASDINKVNIPTGENIVNLYFGNAADACYELLNK